MYTGVIDLDKKTGPNVLKILVIADELELTELINHAQDHLIKDKSSWLEENLVTVIHTVALHQEFSKLKEHTLQINEQKPHLVFEAKDFISLQESELILLLKRDDLSMDEIDVWNAVIKWGVGNTLQLDKTEVSKYTPEDFSMLGKTLQQCIPLIRYFDISAEDYHDKV